MAVRRIFGCILVAVLAFAAFRRSNASEGQRHVSLAVIVHKSSPVDRVTLIDLRRIFDGDLRKWPNSSPVVVIEQPGESATQQRMLLLLLKTTPAAYNRQLLQLQFQGRELAVRVLNSDANAVAFVWNVPGAISVVDAAAAAAEATHIKILKVDGKLPGEPGYLFQ